MAQRTRLAGGVQAFCDLELRDGRWALDTERLREVARGARAVFFASPCMPTGTVFTREETQAFADAAAENDAALIFNGHAERLAYDGREVVHPAALDGMRERTIAIGAVSKDYGMPGWRIGWAAAPRELARALEDTHIFNVIMPGGFAQAGAAAAVGGPQDWQHELRETFQRNRDALLEELEAAPGVEPVSAEGGYYFIADVSGTGLTADEFCERVLAEQDVAVTPMRGWGADDFGLHQVRFIFTNEPEDRLREAGRRVAEFARSLDV
jgi:aspartate/methionine/tyrosine aminotransferase